MTNQYIIVSISMNNQSVESVKDKSLDIKMSAAFGVFISQILDIEDLFRLVAKEYSVAEDSDSDSDSDSNEKSSEDFNEDTFWNIKLHDDIVCEKGQEFQIRADNFCNMEFTYAGNDKIKIGYADCDAFMIYINQSDITPVVSIDIDEQTLKDMCEWKGKLLKENRIMSEDLRFLVKRHYVGYINN